jgi:hypothetical protein
MNESIGPVKLSIWSFITCLLVVIVAVGLTYFLLGWATAGLQRKPKERIQKIKNAVSTHQRQLTECNSTREIVASSDIVGSRSFSFSWGVLDVSKIRRRITWSRKTDDTPPEPIELHVV